jgi:hypothetical protein
MDHIEALAILHGRQSRKLGNNTYLETRPNGAVAVKLHKTDVLTVTPGHVVLNSGGWQTVTTKDRMNTYLPDGWRVWSERGVWRIGHGNASATDATNYTYQDGMTINLESGTVSGAGPAPTKVLKARARVARFAADYMTAFLAGKIPAPSGGDCWFCGLHVAEGPDQGKPLGELRGLDGKQDHIQGHIQERYFVPSMLVNALTAMGASIAQKDAVACRFRGGERSGFDRDDATWLWKHTQRMLTRYLYQQLGMAA